MKKYRLLKELLGHNVGTIFTPWDDPSEIYSPEGEEFPRLSFNEIKDPEWFEEVLEWPKSFDELLCKNWKSTSNSYLFIRNNHSSLKSIRARLKLEQIAAEMNGDWKPDWSNDATKKYCVYRMKNILVVSHANVYAKAIVFKSLNMADFSLKNHKKLWEDYWMINK